MTHYDTDPRKCSPTKRSNGGAAGPVKLFPSPCQALIQIPRHEIGTIGQFSFNYGPNIYFPLETPFLSY